MESSCPFFHSDKPPTVHILYLKNSFITRYNMIHLQWLNATELLWEFNTDTFEHKREAKVNVIYLKVATESQISEQVVKSGNCIVDFPVEGHIKSVRKKKESLEASRSNLVRKFGNCERLFSSLAIKNSSIH